MTADAPLLQWIKVQEWTSSGGTRETLLLSGLLTQAESVSVTFMWHLAPTNDPTEALCGTHLDRTDNARDSSPGFAECRVCRDLTIDLIGELEQALSPTGARPMDRRKMDEMVRHLMATSMRAGAADV